MFLYELLTLLKPFELQSDSADVLIRKNQRPKIPESSKVTVRFLNHLITIFVVGKLYSLPYPADHAMLLEARPQ